MIPFLYGTILGIIGASVVWVWAFWPLGKRKETMSIRETTSIREEVRSRLTEEQLDAEQWVFKIQCHGFGDNEAPIGGIMARCIVIASVRPELPFWHVLQLCKITAQSNIQLTDLGEWLSKMVA